MVAQCYEPLREARPKVVELVGVENTQGHTSLEREYLYRAYQYTELTTEGPMEMETGLLLYRHRRVVTLFLLSNPVDMVAHS